MDCCFVKPRVSSYRIASALRLTLGKRFAGGSTHQTNFRVGNKSAYSTSDLIQDVKTTHFRQAAHAHRDVPGPSWGNGHYDPMHLPMAPRQRARPGKTIEWGKWFHKTPSFVGVFCLRAIDGNSTSYPVGLRSYQISCHHMPSESAVPTVSYLLIQVTGNRSCTACLTSPAYTRQEFQTSSCYCGHFDTTTPIGPTWWQCQIDGDTKLRSCTVSSQSAPTCWALRKPLSRKSPMFSPIHHLSVPATRTAQFLCAVTCWDKVSEILQAAKQRGGNNSPRPRMNRWTLSCDILIYI